MSEVADACACESGLSFAVCCGTRDAASDKGIFPITDPSLPAGIRQGIEEASRCPDLFPVRMDWRTGAAHLVKMSPRWYRESIFLDPARIRGTFLLNADMEWLEAVADAAAWQPAPLIFHTAFCGSTLMANLLDGVFRCLPLREPEALGNLLLHLRSGGSRQDGNVALERVMRLLSRRYHREEPAVIKANDYANGLMARILEQRPHTPVLFMYTPLSEFLAGCLRADNRRQWIRQRYQVVKGLAAELFKLPPGFAVADDGYGEMAALYWSYNVALYQQAWGLGSENLRSLEFNRMLEVPGAAVGRCGEFFGLLPRREVSRDETVAAALGVYSKNPAFGYSPQRRREDLAKLAAQQRAQFGAAEDLAQRLLGGAYPADGLAGSLMER